MEQNSVRNFLIAVVICLALGWAGVAACHAFLKSSAESSRPYSAPASFTVSNEAVAQVVHDAIAGSSGATPMDGSPVVNCTGETNCTISYTLKVSAGALWGSSDDAADRQLLLPTRQMWKAMFTDAQFQSGTISVSGPVTTIGGKSKTDLLFTLSCDRDAASQIDWNNVEGKGLRALCDYHAYVKGLPGYTGLTTPSGGVGGERQFQADIQAHGVPDSIATIPGLGDGACNSVQNGQAPGT